MIYLKTGIALLIFFLFVGIITHAQPCTTLGQTPSTAFPVCGTTNFQQTNVPLCNTNRLFVPGCSNLPGSANYENKNPFFYKFTCYTSGSLGFVITPVGANEDYDWQLYDITGRNPDDIFTINSLVVTGNWSGSYGPTGAQAGGATSIQCASDPITQNIPRFAAMPALIAGHEYLLMVSHWTDNQSGYDLSFSGGTAVITNSAKPHMLSAKAGCDGKTITIKLTKKVLCNSLANGSEFSLVPLSSVAISAVTDSCAFGFDFDEVTITLASPLKSGTHQLSIHNGSDLNSLLDACGNEIPAGETISFDYFIPQPIFADSISRVGCAPDSLKIYFPKKINCNSIAADGSDFSVSGPTTAAVFSAGGNCINGKTDYVIIKFSSPVYSKGNYQLNLKAGTDGSVLIDECGQQTPLQTLPFSTVDTVSAEFTFTTALGCRSNTLNFMHDGAHNVNEWNWTFNNSSTTNTQTVTKSFSASSGSNIIKLEVSNGVCTDSASTSITLNNEVKASFEMQPVICPEDPLAFTNTSTGQVDSWLWKFDMIGSSTLKDPPPLQLPNNNDREIFYSVKLIARNNALNCSDSINKTVRVFNTCLIAVPTAFTPNGDGLNDFLRPHNAIKADNLEFKVYNRWGQLVFVSHNWQEKWDGKINGVPQGSGVYVWFLSYTHHDTGEKNFQKGTTMLIR